MIFDITNREFVLLIIIGVLCVLCVSLAYMVYMYMYPSPLPSPSLPVPVPVPVPRVRFSSPLVKQKVCDEEMCYIKEEKDDIEDINVIPENTDTVSEDDNILTIDEKEDEV